MTKKSCYGWPFKTLTAGMAICLCTTTLSTAQSTEVFASGLVAPQGLTVDASGNVWVAEQGSGNTDGRISVITPDGQVHDFLTGLQSNIVQGEAESVHHLIVRNDTLWATLGLGEDDPAGFLIHVDVSQFTPGDPPLGLQDMQQEDIGSFVVAHNFTEDTDQTNIYNFAFGANDQLFIVDASANAVLMRRPDGQLSVFAEILSVPNPTPVGPPALQAVPTGIVYRDGLLYVTSFLGFPFPPGASRIYTIEQNGTVTEFESGFSSLVDITIGPDDSLILIEYGTFSNGFTSFTGDVLRLTDAGEESLVASLNYPTGVAFDNDGFMYVSSFKNGEIRKSTFQVTSIEDHLTKSASIDIAGNYPNPFSSKTTVEYSTKSHGNVTLIIYDGLGRVVRTLVDHPQAPGHYSVPWDGTDDSGNAVASGMYLGRLHAELTSSSTHSITLIR